MTDKALPLVKANLGISPGTTIRDSYLKAIINGILSELKNEKGLTLDQEDAAHLIFLVDFAVFRYNNHGGGDMPRHLKRRLNNLFINRGRTAKNV